MFRLWPVLLIAAGVRSLVRAPSLGVAVTSTLVTVGGAVLLLDTLNILDVNVFELWPLFLIVVGLQMLLRARAGWPRTAPVADPSEASVAFLGGVKRRNRSADFRGGSASAVLGGVELDLSEADMQGDEAVLNVSAMMGGIAIRIPHSWTLENKVTPILGGVEDRTRDPVDAGKRFVIQGVVVMGGVEIKN